MTDKSWMLNPKAIRYAKECMHIVRDELGVKLTLSHPDFIHLLHEYVEMLDSSELGLAYSRLISMAGPGAVVKSLKSKEEIENNIVDLPVKKAAGHDSAITENSTSSEFVSYHGKDYPKSRDGKEFKGLYRGQPIYR